MIITTARPTISTRSHFLYVISTSSAERLTVLAVRKRPRGSSMPSKLALSCVPGLIAIVTVLPLLDFCFILSYEEPLINTLIRVKCWIHPSLAGHTPNREARETIHPLTGTYRRTCACAHGHPHLTFDIWCVSLNDDPYLSLLLI